MTKQNLYENLPPRVDVIGVPISAVTMGAALSFVAENLEALRGEYVCASNVHTTVMARENAQYLAVQSESVMSLPDGKPLSVVGRKKAPCPMEKVTGTHFMQNIFTDPRFAGKKHYFYGTGSEDLERMIDTFSGGKVCVNTNHFLHSRRICTDTFGNIRHTQTAIVLQQTQNLLFHHINLTAYSFLKCATGSQTASH